MTNVHCTNIQIIFSNFYTIHITSETILWWCCPKFNQWLSQCQWKNLLHNFSYPRILIGCKFCKDFSWCKFCWWIICDMPENIFKILTCDWLHFSGFVVYLTKFSTNPLWHWIICLTKFAHQSCTTPLDAC